ncbi:MAG: septal ring lytic transglycosylase RlpA family protein [Alphaproteobacteria bacterium]|nr:septal ring lytic transglycosylase RlpA family protein [Alphaproteobacteria bacterium]USO08366.1 MAG: septal ring lytic transglycosylase RlpA family protein [Rhodospirillales bacterium]
MRTTTFLKQTWATALIRVCLALALVGVCITDARASECHILQKGIASVYAWKFQGRKTASGALLDMNKNTAAHRTLPHGAKIKVTDRRTGRSTYVTINDRGPFVKGRILDVTHAASHALGWGDTGLHRVTISLCEEN